MVAEPEVTIEVPTRERVPIAVDSRTRRDLLVPYSFVAIVALLSIPATLVAIELAPIFATYTGLLPETLQQSALSMTFSPGSPATTVPTPVVAGLFGIYTTTVILGGLLFRSQGWGAD